MGAGRSKERRRREGIYTGARSEQPQYGGEYQQQENYPSRYRQYYGRGRETRGQEEYARPSYGSQRRGYDESRYAREEQRPQQTEDYSYGRRGGYNDEPQYGSGGRTGGGYYDQERQYERVGGDGYRGYETYGQGGYEREGQAGQEGLWYQEDIRPPSALRGTWDKAMGSMQAGVGKMMKKPDLVECGQARKTTGQAQVLLAKHKPMPEQAEFAPRTVEESYGKGNTTEERRVMRETGYDEQGKYQTAEAFPARTQVVNKREDYILSPQDEQGQSSDWQQQQPAWENQVEPEWQSESRGM